MLNRVISWNSWNSSNQNQGVTSLETTSQISGYGCLENDSNW